MKTNPSLVNSHGVKLMWNLILCSTLLAWLRPSAASGADSAGSAGFGPKWKEFIGEWQGENASGVKIGTCGFRFDLSEHVIVRNNHAELPAANGGRAAVHDDLMVIYPGPSAEKASAIYFDNEGHVIEYTALWSAEGNELTFLSKPGPGPRFRLVYKKLATEVWAVNFEISPPGQSDAFKPYATGKIRRAAR